MENKNLSEYKKKTWKIICYISIVFFLSALFFLLNNLFDFFPKKEIKEFSGKIADIPEVVCNNCASRILDGVSVENSKENLFPFAVIIDNHPDARPAYGLSKANLVIEAEAEGGITRYFAVFSGHENIDKIGPVRSVRSYFVDWTEELSALLVHCGGSPEALVRIAQEGVYDLNEFYNEKLFWRDSELSAPHNVFTSTEKLRGYLSDKNLLEGKYLGWKFSDGELPAEVVNPEIKIYYYSLSLLENDFAVSWKYDIINNNYLRYLGGDEHKDGEGSEIRASNVVIQSLDKKIIDDKLRISLNVVGEGEAVVCNKGQCVDGYWKKENKASRTRFYDINNNEFYFIPGNIWIEAVDKSININY